ncbi:hypothetical protein [Planktotalea sp.]|uniref:hypothetical protein n=1 Tax=Planktotalea sp. TaxID=2029877 RepID=UPI0032972BFB
MSTSHHIPDNIIRVSCSLSYVLWLNGTDHWFGFTTILRSRLEPRECAALAFAALRSLSDEDAVQVGQTALLDGAGQPIAPLFSFLNEATSWADLATPDELKAYCLACFRRMKPEHQVSFLEYVQTRRAA